MTCPQDYAADAHRVHRKQRGGLGQFARVRLALEPRGENQSGLVFEDRGDGNLIPQFTRLRS